jgi:hypothetical protein
MEHVGGSLPEVTVCVEGEISGRGENLFILLLHLLKPQKEKPSSVVYFFTRLAQGSNHGFEANAARSETHSQQYLTINLLSGFDCRWKGRRPCLAMFHPNQGCEAAAYTPTLVASTIVDPLSPPSPHMFLSIPSAATAASCSTKSAVPVSATATARERHAGRGPICDAGSPNRAKVAIFVSRLSWCWVVGVVLLALPLLGTAVDYNLELKDKAAEWITNKALAVSKYGLIEEWDTSKVTMMAVLWSGKSDFNADLSAWDVAAVKSMEWMFEGASVFTSDLNGWDVSGVTSIDRMFVGASVFKSDLNAWDVSGVTSIEGPFSGSTNFTSDLNAWDVSGVTYMD